MAGGVKNPKRKTASSAEAALAVLRALLGDWWRVAELADLLGQDEKTARRHLAAVRRAGFPLAVRTERHYGRKQYRVVLDAPRRRNKP